VNILVVGRSGQVARALKERAVRGGVSLMSLGRPDLDLCDDASIEQAIFDARPQVVINAAAYTAVDRAEDDADHAWRVNAHAAGLVADAAQRSGAAIIHLSTDYVYSGASAKPYRETDETGPTSVYGESKLEGERLVREANPRAVIIRTAWVFDACGANFMRAMLRKALTDAEIPVVADQLGCPTSADALAQALLAIAASMEHPGTYHCVCTGEASWAEFAEAIFEQALARGGPVARVRPIRTEDYPTRARRPANSRLNCDKIEKDYGVRLPSWKSALTACIDQVAVDGWRLA